MEFALPNFADFHFLRPLWLLGLIPVILFLSMLWRLNSTVTAWDRAIDHDLLPFLLDRSKNTAQRTPLYLLAAAWVLTIIALSGPVWQKLPQPVQRREDALVIILDLSLSMFAPDHVPNRLDLAKRKLRDILDLRNEGQTALIVYAGDAHTVTPLTDDTVTITALVPSLTPNIMPLFGSNPVMALQMAISLLNDVQAQSGRILLMTDGIDGFTEEQQLVDLMAGTGYRLLVMGIGTEEGAPIRTSDGGFLTDTNGEMVIPTLNRGVLQSLANRTNGRYHDIQLSDADITYLMADYTLDDEELSDVEEEFDIWYEPAPWLLVLILPLVALSFRRGWLFGAVLVIGSGVLVPSQKVYALEWKDLWLTKDQQAARAMAADDYVGAINLFRLPQWAGVAHYRNGDYDSAIAGFSSENTADAHYNRGNALALNGNYQEAIAAYDIAIAIDANHEDAIHNKEIVEKLLQQEESEASEDQSESMENQENQSGSDQEQQDQENQEQQDQESQEGNQEQEQQEQQNQQAPEEQESSESNSEQNTPSDSETEEFEEQQSLEQWLRRIDDDPGELLQRKFRYQYRQRQLNGTSNNLQSGGPIW